MDNTVMAPHVSQRFNKDMENLFNKVLGMGGHVEEQLSQAFEALRKSDAQKAKEVISMDRFINRQESNVNEICIRILARQQPAANDLRLILAALRIVADLERVGDEITKLSKTVIALSDRQVLDFSTIPGYQPLVEMSVCAQEMMKATLDAFAHLDVKKALTLVPKELKADEEYKAAQMMMREHMMTHPDMIPNMLDLMNALRAMERVTDHALNIAEQVFYVTEGTDIRQVSAERLAEIGNTSIDAE